MTNNDSLYRKTIKGYTAQARFYARHLEQGPTDEWVQLGWIPDRGGSKPVFQMVSGPAIAIYQGIDHLTVHIQGIDPTAIRATEEECFATSPYSAPDAPLPGDIGMMGHLKGGF